MANPLLIARTAALVYRMQFASIFGSKRVLAALVLAAIPPLLGALGSKLMPESVEGQEMTGAAIFAVFGWFLSLNFVVPMLSVSIAVGAIADEVESRTITYPFTRPIPRSGLLLGRWLASLTLILALTLGSLAVLAFVADWRSPGPSRELVTAMMSATAVGALVYSVGAAVVGAQFKRGLIIALAYAFAFELLVANIPGSGQTLTVQYHLRAMVVDEAVLAFDDPGFVRTESMIGAAESLRKLAIIAGGLLVYGCWRVSRKQFVLSS